MFLVAQESRTLAQVVTPTAVGYVNVSLPRNQSVAIACQLVYGTGSGGGAANRVELLFPASRTPDGFEIRKLGADGVWETNMLSGGSWTDPDMTLMPGEGAVALSPLFHTVAFVGSIQEGILRQYVPAGESLVSSMIPQSGKVSTELGLPLVDGVQLSTLRPDGTWVEQGRISGGAWVGGLEPFVDVGQSVRISTTHSFVWERSFFIDANAPVPRFEAVPAPQEVAAGGNLSLEVAVTRSPEARLQWRRNGVDIPGATGATLKLTGATQAQAGDYQLVVFDGSYFAASPVIPVSVSGAATSGPRLSLARPAPGGRWELGIAGTTGSTVDVQWSANLHDWQDLASGVAVPGNVALEADPTIHVRFFRVRTR